MSKIHPKTRLLWGQFGSQSVNQIFEGIPRRAYTAGRPRDWGAPADADEAKLHRLWGQCSASTCQISADVRVRVRFQCACARPAVRVVRLRWCLVMMMVFWCDRVRTSSSSRLPSAPLALGRLYCVLRLLMMVFPFPSIFPGIEL